MSWAHFRAHFRAGEAAPQNWQSWTPIPHPTALGDKLGRFYLGDKLHSRLAFPHLHSPFFGQQCLDLRLFCDGQSCREQEAGPAPPCPGCHSTGGDTALGVTQPQLQVMNQQERRLHQPQNTQRWAWSCQQPRLPWLPQPKVMIWEPPGQEDKSQHHNKSLLIS